MKINSCQIGTGTVSLADRVSPFKVKVTMGSNEPVKKSGSYVEFGLYINNGDHTPVYIKYLNADLTEETGLDGEFSISAGGSKTFSFAELWTSGPDELTYIPGGSGPITLLDALKELSGDDGAARKYTAQLHVAIQSGDKWYSAHKNDACELLLYRLKPEILSYTYSDRRIGLNGKSAYEHFGYYVRGKSMPSLSFEHKIDQKDIGLTSTNVLTVHYPDGRSIAYYRDGSIITHNFVFDLETPQVAGKYRWEYEVRDSAGYASSISGEYDVIDYVEPSIEIFDVDRYIISLNDKGEEVYTEAGENEGGKNVWADIRATVYAFPDFAGKNETYIYLASGRNSGTEDTTLIYRGQNGIYVNTMNDRTVYTSTVEEAFEYQFTLQIYDFFHGHIDNPIERTVIVRPAGADFNIESFGVAVGMYSTGDAEHKLFEVAKSHGVKIYGEIKQIGDLSSEWIPLTPLNGSTPGTYGGPLRCRAFGDKRIIDGSVSIKPGSETVDIAMLPDGFAPEYDKFMMAACQAAGTGTGNIARIVVAGKTNQSNPDDVGKLRLSWIKRMATGEDVTSGQHWVDCSMEYWVN